MTAGRLPQVWTALLALVMVAVLFSGCSSKPDPECELLTWDGYEITITLLDGTEETRQAYPSEEGLDADGDEVDDCAEFLNGTDPNDADTSGNGLLDGRNVTLDEGDRRLAKWMDDGIVHEEQADGRVVFVGTAEYGLDSTKQDHAGSGIMDGEEVGGFEVWILGERHVVKTDPRTKDTSSDGLTDSLKRDMGLDPRTKDTNGDGVSDTEDVNPWIEFKVRMEVVSLNLTKDPFGRNEAGLTFFLNIRNFQETSVGPARVGETTGGEPFSTGELHPSNGGGGLLKKDHNMSFDLTVLTESGGEQRRVDLFSQTTDSPYLSGAVHGLTGELVHGPKGARQPWPASATFEGEHGDVTLRLVPVWPEDWQRCIDEGCRHGDGDFEWR